MICSLKRLQFQLEFISRNRASNAHWVILLLHSAPVRQQLEH